MLRLCDQLLSAFALLTRLPLPNHRPTGAASAWAWPLVGAVLGGLATLPLWLASLLQPGPIAALVLIVLALMTGALHEDGLADTADGLLGGRDRARRLEIMKDSRIGSFGALALLLVTLASWSALEALITSGRAFSILIACACLSRLPMAAMMALMPPARSTGLAAGMGRPAPLTLVMAMGTAILPALALLGPSGLMVSLLVMALTTGLLASAAMVKIGGQTGDILGASQQLAFAASLTALA